LIFLEFRFVGVNIIPNGKPVDKVMINKFPRFCTAQPNHHPFLKFIIFFFNTDKILRAVLQIDLGSICA
jgi:hypothetical protein